MGMRVVGVVGWCALIGVLAGCGTTRIPEAPSSTTTRAPFGVTMTATPTGPSSSGTEPPLSQIPPPTMTQPAPPPKNPSDALVPVTLTGSAAKHAPTGCILLTTPGATVELVGALAPSALSHARVTVVAMPHPERPSPCDVVTMEVQSLVAAT